MPVRADQPTACQKCKSTRIIEVIGKTNDRNAISVGVHNTDDFKGHTGYVPKDMGLTQNGDEDSLAFRLCLGCGLIQGIWPVPLTKLEQSPRQGGDGWADYYYSRE